MADNVDISLKLGTEADISSAINAGARAGAAFAAAAQSAVNGISLSTSTSMRAFTTSSRQISGSSDLRQEIRSLGLTNGLIAQMAIKAATGGNGGYLPPPSKPFAATWPQLPSTGRTNVGFYRGDPRFWGGTTSEPVPVNQLAANDNISKVIAYQQAMLKIQRGAFGSDGRGGHFGGGGNIYDAEFREGGRGGSFKSGLFKALALGKFAQNMMQPWYDYTVQEAEATYKAQTERSTRGFRQEQLDKLVAENKMKGTYSKIGGVGLGAALALGVGLLAAPFTGGLSLGAGAMLVGAGAVGGGIAGSRTARDYEKQSKKAEQDLLQQYKSLNEAQKRYYANSLFGGNYNVSFARAVAGLGIGATEEEMMANSTTALTFRGDLARGKISAGQMQALAFMPNTLANYINEETDPATLMAGYRADFAALGDPSLAASVAKDVTGLGTYVAATSGVYGQMANRWNMNMLGMADSMSNSVVGGYMNRQAFNTVTDQLTAAAMFMKNAHDAPESFWGGQAKPTDKENDWGNFLYRWGQMVSTQGQLNNMPPMIINLNVDGETLKSVNVGEQIKERTSFLTGGQSFIAGGY